ncbi:MAG: N-acetylmuramoyl-L-alanine amidase [Lachnospiraceae bacterium]|nr:N-acetylmuramoyl-L-alanine amidase [Lachnospiraceae bacterium]
MEERSRQRYRSKRIQSWEKEKRESGRNQESKENREPGRNRGQKENRGLGRNGGSSGKRPQRRKRRRRRQQVALRIGICAVLAALGILLIVLLFMLGSAVSKGVKGGDFSGFSFPWEKAEAVIMLDAGHGGKDQGTSYGDILEKELTLEITKRVEKLLKDAGYAVEMIRTGDDSMNVYERSRHANQKEPDVFVSIHCNFLERGEASGIETYYGKDRGQDSQSLAEKIQASTVEKTGAVDRGARTEDFVVVKETKMPAALIEVGFLSDPHERELLQDEEYQKKLAQGIADGIMDYWESQKEAETGTDTESSSDTP